MRAKGLTLAEAVEREFVHEDLRGSVTWIVPAVI